ncbi:MAG: oligosaccharide flippase family protein [Acidobacteriota bacterium]
MFQRIQQLVRHLVIYGVGDAATSLVSLLLLRLFTHYLTPADYGVITLLLTVEAVTRILFRWGTDSAFMRLYYDCKNERDQQRLTSTIIWFLLGVDLVVVLAAFACTPLIGRYFFESAVHDGLVRLVIFNTFIGTFLFIPNCLLRIREQSLVFAGLTFVKSSATIAVRLVLVIPMRMGVDGVVWSDTIVTVALIVIMARWVLPLLRPVFSLTLLREALRFGLPRLPHAIAHQAIAVSDRWLMAYFLTQSDIGLYGVGSSFGQALKLFLNGFEFAWAPFYFGSMHRSDAKIIYARLTTYVFGAVVLLAAGLSAIATDLVRLMAAPEFGRASIVIPATAIGVVAQAAYQVTAIGLNITKQAKYFPIATTIAAVVSITGNLIVMPRFGLIGAAYMNAVAYSVLTLAAGWFAYRVYPVQYEWRRIGCIAIAGIVSYLGATLAVPVFKSALAGLLARGTLVVLIYPLILVATGSVEPAEREHLVGLFRSLRGAKPEPVMAEETNEMGGEILSGSVEYAGEGDEPDAPPAAGASPQKQ